MADPGQYGNWLGVLRWTLAQSDGLPASDAKPMSAEDKAFLTAVFESMTVDEVKRMEDIGAVLALGFEHVLARMEAGGVGEPATSKPAPAPVSHGGGTAAPARLVDRKLAALDELDDIVSSLDNAKNLFVVGAFPPLLTTARYPGNLVMKAVATAAREAGSGDAGAVVKVTGLTSWQQLRVATRALEVMATAVQNNPKAQSWACEAGALPALTQSLAWGVTAVNAITRHTRHAASLCRYVAACLTASSALLRDNVAAQRELMRAGDATQVPSMLGDIIVLLQVWRDHEVWKCAPQVEVDEEVDSDDDVEAAAMGKRASDNAPLQARRCVKKALFLLRHLVNGAQADAVKSLLLLGWQAVGVDHIPPTALTRPSSSSFLPYFLALFNGVPRGLHGTAPVPEDDNDVVEVREAGLAILAAILEPSPPVVPVVDDSDNRELVTGPDGRKQQIIVVKPPAAGADSGVDTSSATPMLLGDATPPATGAQVPSTLPVPAVLATPTAAGDAVPATSTPTTTHHRQVATLPLGTRGFLMVHPDAALRETLERVYAGVVAAEAGSGGGGGDGASGGPRGAGDEAEDAREEEKRLAQALWARLQVVARAVAASGARVERDVHTVD